MVNRIAMEIEDFFIPSDKAKSWVAHSHPPGIFNLFWVPLISWRFGERVDSREDGWNVGLQVSVTYQWRQGLILDR